jgi:hypothetical protein
MYHWAQSGKPLLTVAKWPKLKYVTALSFIDTKKGNVLTKYREGAFKGPHIATAIRQVSRLYPDDDVVIFGDNCGIHKTQEVKDTAESEGVELWYNMRYRPDMMGCEGLWRIAKRKYKAEVAKRLISKKIAINNMQLVRACVGGVSDEECKQEAARGWLQLLKAKPRDYEEEGEMVLDTESEMASAVEEAEVADAEADMDVDQGDSM